MGDQNTLLTEDDARQLIRRLGFGIPVKESKKFRVSGLTGLTRGAAADLFLNFRPKGFKPKSNEIEKAINKWYKYILKRKKNLALQEKLVIFFHDHFATNFSTLDAQGPADVARRKMAEQNKMFRKNCIGNFKTLVKLVNVNLAMMDFLDTVLNTKDEPNENYGRELQELFTLGATDLNGEPNYTEDDVGQVSRAFTGWNHEAKDGSQHLRAAEHDTTAEFPARGPKVIFGTAHPVGGGHNYGGFAGPQSFIVGGEAENEIDEVTEILFQHLDTDGENTVARHLTFKLVEYFCHASPSKATVDAIVAEAGFVGSWEMVPLLRSIIVHDIMYETAVPAPFGALTKKSVRWPVDYTIGTLRSVGLKPKGGELQIPGGNFRNLGEFVAEMGQVLLEPPSVFGWNWEESWISSAGLLARFEFVRDVVASRGKFKPEKLINTDLTDPGDIVDAVTDQLGLTSQFTATQRTTLIDYLTDEGTNPTLDLNDFDTRNRKLHGLYGLVLQSAAAVLH